MVWSGCIIIYASHYTEEIDQLCDEIAFIDHGEIIESGTLEILLKKHTLPAVFMQSEKELPSFLQRNTTLTKKNNGYLIESDETHSRTL